MNNGGISSLSLRMCPELEIKRDPKQMVNASELFQDVHEVLSPVPNHIQHQSLSRGNGIRSRCVTVLLYEIGETG